MTPDSFVLSGASAQMRDQLDDLSMSIVAQIPRCVIGTASEMLELLLPTANYRLTANWAYSMHGIDRVEVRLCEYAIPTVD